MLIMLFLITLSVRYLSLLIDKYSPGTLKTLSPDCMKDFGDEIALHRVNSWHQVHISLFRVSLPSQIAS